MEDGPWELPGGTEQQSTEQLLGACLGNIPFSLSAGQPLLPGKASGPHNSS